MMTKKYEYTYELNFGLFKSEEYLFEELLKKYYEYGTLYIGMDFDNTLKVYETDSVMTHVVMVLRRAKQLGMKLCLWTLPTDESELSYKIRWCETQGIKADYVNMSPLMREQSKRFGKPHFNLLLDDTAGLEESWRILWNLCEALENSPCGPDAA